MTQEQQKGAEAPQWLRKHAELIQEHKLGPTFRGSLIYYQQVSSDLIRYADLIESLQARVDELEGQVYGSHIFHEGQEAQMEDLRVERDQYRERFLFIARHLDEIAETGVIPTAVENLRANL